MNFPLVSNINLARESLHSASHTDSNSFTQRITSWMGHKVLTVISVPANILTAGFCAAAFTASACTLGAFKIFVFACTLGHIKLSFSTGCYWLAKETISAISAIFRNSIELLYDTAKIIEGVYDSVRWVGRKLGLDGLFNAIFKQIGEFFVFIGKRVFLGVVASADREPVVTWGKVPAPLNLVNDPTKQCRIDFSSDSRSFGNIFKHSALSVINIPLNTVAAVCSGIATVALSTLFVSKTIVFAATNLDIPIPTYAAKAFNILSVTTTNILADVGTDVADIFVSVFKISDAIGLNRAIVTVLKVVKFIPEAIFG